MKRSLFLLLFLLSTVTAFSQVAVMSDDFNRADGTLGSNWVAPDNYGSGTLAIASNAAKATNTTDSLFGAMAWNSTLGLTDSFRIDLNIRQLGWAGSSKQDQMRIYFRCNTKNRNSVTGYALQVMIVDTTQPVIMWMMQVNSWTAFLPLKMTGNGTSSVAYSTWKTWTSLNIVAKQDSLILYHDTNIRLWGSKDSTYEWGGFAVEYRPANWYLVVEMMQMTTPRPTLLDAISIVTLKLGPRDVTNPTISSISPTPAPPVLMQNDSMNVTISAADDFGVKKIYSRLSGAAGAGSLGTDSVTGTGAQKSLQLTTLKYKMTSIATYYDTVTVVDDSAHSVTQVQAIAVAAVSVPHATFSSLAKFPATYTDTSVYCWERATVSVTSGSIDSIMFMEKRKAGPWVKRKGFHYAAGVTGSVTVYSDTIKYSQDSMRTATVLWKVWARTYGVSTDSSGDSSFVVQNSPKPTFVSYFWDTSGVARPTVDTSMSNVKLGARISALTGTVDSIFIRRQIGAGAWSNYLIVKCGTTADTTVRGAAVKYNSLAPTFWVKYRIWARTKAGMIDSTALDSFAVVPKVTSFQIIAYWYIGNVQSNFAYLANTADPQNVAGNWARMTDVTMWFAENPDTDYGVSFYNPATRAADSLHLYEVTGGKQFFPRFRDSIHAHGNKIVIVIYALAYYGGDYSNWMDIIFKSDAKTKVFAGGVARLCRDFGYDGVGINWEELYAGRKPRARENAFWHTLRDTLRAYNINGGNPLLSVTPGNYSPNAGTAENWDLAAMDSLVSWVDIEGGASNSGCSLFKNPSGLFHPKCLDQCGFNFADTAYQSPGTKFVNYEGYAFLGQFRGVGPTKTEALSKSKISVFIDPDSRADGTTGPCGPSVAEGSLTVVNGGSVNYGGTISYIEQQYYQPGRLKRDSTQNCYLYWNDGTDHVVPLEDSVSLTQKVQWLISHGYSKITINEASARIMWPSGWLGNGDRLSWWTWIRQAAGSASGSQPVLLAPTGLIPTNGAISQGSINAGAVSVSCSWITVAGADGYQISVYRDPGQTLLQFSSVTNGTTISVGSLSPNTIYYWKVAGTLGGSPGPYATLQSFTTTYGGVIYGNVPLAPVWKSPVNGSTGVTQPDTLRWSKTDSTVTWDVQYTPDTINAAAYVTNTGLSDTSLAIAYGLGDGTKYFSRARGINPRGNGPYNAWAHWTVATIGNAGTFPKTRFYMKDSSGVPRWDKIVGFPWYRVLVKEQLLIPDGGAIMFGVLPDNRWIGRLSDGSFLLFATPTVLP